MNEYALAEIAYNAYCAARGWKSVRGEPLPKFEEQSEELKEAWMTAADAVANAVVGHIV